ncbi:MAG: hypothetical protein FJ271_14530 [Planctomycetes bacterium]|nr:hypothetical protein [Planctomycetota bacterium]
MARRDFDDEDEAPRRRKARRSDEDDETPRKSKKKSRQRDDEEEPSSSRGLLIWASVGGGVLIVGLIVVVIVLVSRPGGADPANTKVKKLGPTQSFVGDLNSEAAGKTYKITVECDPETEIEIVVEAEIEDNRGRRREQRLGQTRSRGKTCSMSFVAPGFGRIPFRVTNHGTGAATCTISHNGIRPGSPGLKF